MLPRAFVTSVVGSWPRPKWLLEAFERREAGIIDDETLKIYMDDAVRLAIKDQEEAGIDVVTDGEQRRTSFVAFVGQKLRGFKVVKVEELHPDAREIMKRHKAPLTIWRPVIAGPIEDSVLAADEAQFARQVASRPIKVTLPSPYLIMWESWHQRISAPYYPRPEDAAEAYAKALRREVARLIDAGVAFIQLDEPMLGDLLEAAENEPDRYKKVAQEIYGQKYRGLKDEIRLAVDLVNEVVQGYTTSVRIGMHLDRWPAEDSPIVGYEKLAPYIFDVKVKQYVVEYKAPRMGDPTEFAKILPSDKELGLGSIDVRDHKRVETVDEVVAHVEKVVKYVDPTRIWLNPDCGFAPGQFRAFPRDVARAKLKVMVEAAKALRQKYWWA
ncbi:MAG: cobalamin-independent methionine synthase II family protein [Thermoproteus sp. AZ2]|jgi:5-methyltetrahydropteroyltriglutamate--homocysteine methyltransferase|uniref:Cobalamin-independent methionine synthase II family protein n=1 Tax=Thermoproteus sp. AZ2 TaxID=1609232 RepID=A0ACC6V2B2_9CREN|nr:MAG: 5-methyltetrahydropteroyltriglutamate--homocysteine methyltransferase [Thermoproteus sp. AZ2]